MSSASQSVVLLSLFFLACNSLSCTDRQDLGDNFELVEFEKGDANILYCFRDCRTSGIPAVPVEVVQVKHNSRWIVAKTRSGQPDSVSYWIVDKKIRVHFDYDINFSDSVKNNVYGPLGSLQFDSMLTKNNIELELEQE